MKKYMYLHEVPIRPRLRRGGPEDDPIPVEGTMLDDNGKPIIFSLPPVDVVGKKLNFWDYFNKHFRSKEGWRNYLDKQNAKIAQNTDAINIGYNPEAEQYVAHLPIRTGTPSQRQSYWNTIASTQNNSPFNPNFGRYPIEDKDGQIVGFTDDYNTYMQSSQSPEIKQSEILTDSQGNVHTNPSAGYLSPVDPVAELYIGDKALGPAFTALGRGLQHVGARLGFQPARNAIMGRAFNNAADRTFGFDNRFINTPTSSIAYEVEPNVRFKVGDLEINNPELAYRQGSAEMGEDFLKRGYVAAGDGSSFRNPMFNQGGLWYGVPTIEQLKNARKGITFTTKNGLTFNFGKANEIAPKTDVLVTSPSLKMSNADNHSSRISDIVENDFSTYARETTRRVPTINNSATVDNTALYRFDPNYGYREVSTPTSLADPWGVNTLVDDFGNLTKTPQEMLSTLYHKFPFIQLKDITNKGFGKRTNLAEHIADVVKSAQEYPLPKNVSRQEFVTSALYHDLGKIYNTGTTHGNTSNWLVQQLNLPTTNNIIKAIDNHMNPQQYFENANPLEKALHAADVGRGRPYDDLVKKWSYLKYKYGGPLNKFATGGPLKRNTLELHRPRAKYTLY